MSAAGVQGKRTVGIVKVWKIENGYGFAKVEGEGDVFIHYSSIETDDRRSLEVGEKVELEIVPGREPGKVKGIHVVVVG